MNFVKLYASASTNEDLKARFRESELPNLTTFYTHVQTHGKGQRGTSWESEDYKNLTFSILITETGRFDKAFSLNKLVSVALVTWLQQHLNVVAKIKWPNDILSVNHKLAGILIETLYKGGKKTCVIVGIGLNVNQTVFYNAPKAISLKQLTGAAHDLEVLLHSFLQHFEYCYQNLTNVDELYLKYFYKHLKKQAVVARDKEINAIIYGVNDHGKLLLKNDDIVQEYDLKEVKWLY